MTTIELVRHAKAHSRDRWWGKPDRKRPLTDSGHDQARDLARAILAAGPVDALWSSPFVRCVQTLEPLATKAALPVQSLFIGHRGKPRLTTCACGQMNIDALFLSGIITQTAGRALCNRDPDQIVAINHRETNQLAAGLGQPVQYGLSHISNARAAEKTYTERCELHGERIVSLILNLTNITKSNQFVKRAVHATWRLIDMLGNR